MTDPVDSPTRIRLALRERGYHPVPVAGPDMNVPSAGKRPLMSKWQIRCLDASPTAIEGWERSEPGSVNTGLLTGALVGADIDVLRPDLAAAIEARAVEVLGPTPLRRIGRAPKALLCYRVALPVDKIQTAALHFTADDAEKPTKIEVLGRGQQFVAYGIHPETRRPYDWPDGSPLAIDFADLPEVTEGQLRTFVAEAEEMIRAAGGATRQERRRATAKQETEGRRAAGLKDGAPPDQATIAAALEHVPNDFDYDGWVRIGFALYDGLGPAGQDLWERWSATSPRNDPAVTARKWPTFAQGRTVSVATLFWHAAQNGWRRAGAQRRAAREARASEPDAGTAEPGDDGRPVIRVAGGNLPSVVTRGERALIDAGLGLYQRGGLVVRPALVKVAVADGRKTIGVRLVPVRAAHVAELMTRAARWERYDGRAEDWVPIDCPQRVADTYLAREGQWRLPIISGVVNCPVPRPDGSILDAPGYDEATGLLYDPQGVAFDPLRGVPSKDSAAHALDHLRRLVATFPFVRPVDRSVALSGILTGMARRALPTAPMHGFDAPTAGSGKSLLVDIASMILDGRQAAVMSLGKSEDEAEKRLGAALIAGDAVISIDNVERPVGGDLFCQAITQETLKVRILGLSKLAEVPSNAAMFATGNNLVFVGDMTRRALLCRLDPGVERPETREFAVKPLDEIRRNRPLYVRAALTVLLAFHVAGRPRQAPPLGSFEAWSGWVRDALIWLGEPDPCETMEGLREADPKLVAFRAVVTQWREVIGEERVSAKDVIARAIEPDGSPPDYDTGYADRRGRGFRHSEFREALLSVAGEGGQISNLRLGQWLSRNKGRLVNGCRIVEAGTSAGVVRWMLSALPSL
ncbi:PriCT-2 domain-containing protein [Methylobacterium sp. ID0610]|uniref:PriCT-2 domain-containing protein n=1 Tax=Methylobacterium carpenticola TaxID=3344827 RepID=UPI0036916D67